MANAIRALAMDAVEQAKSGHPGMPMGVADAATALFTQFLLLRGGAGLGAACRRRVRVGALTRATRRLYWHA
jgi:transketolase N-terminal domain/subunit